MPLKKPVNPNVFHLERRLPGGFRGNSLDRKCLFGAIVHERVRRPGVASVLPIESLELG